MSEKAPELPQIDAYQVGVVALHERPATPIRVRAQVITRGAFTRGNERIPIEFRITEDGRYEVLASGRVFFVDHEDLARGVQDVLQREMGYEALAREHHLACPKGDPVFLGRELVIKTYEVPSLVPGVLPDGRREVASIQCKACAQTVEWDLQPSDVVRL